MISQEEYDGLRASRLSYKNQAAALMRQVEGLEQRLELERRYRDVLRERLARAESAVFSAVHEARSWRNAYLTREAGR